MTNFETLQSINLKEVEDQQIRTQIQGILEDVASEPQAPGKEAMVEELSEVIDYLLEAVQEDFPQALIAKSTKASPAKEEKKEDSKKPAAKEEVATKPQEKPKPKSKTPGKEEPKEDQAAKRKALLGKLESWEADFEACQVKIKEYKATQRALEGPKTKEKKPLHERLQDKILSIVRMTPTNLQVNEEIQQENNRIALEAKLAFMSNWGLTNSLKKGEKEMLKGLREVEDKFDDRQRRELVKKWAKEMPSDKKIASVEKANDDLIKSITEEIKRHLKEAMNHWKEDEQAGLDYLREMLSEEQQEAYLPSYILERL